MRKISVPLIFLSLFTSAERAAEIEGDLLEQAATHGRLWFAAQVLLTALALFRQTLMQQPLLVLLPGYAIYELILKVHQRIMLPLGLYLKYDLDYTGAASLLVIRSIWVAVGYLLGFVLVRYLPKTGMHAVIIASALGMARVLLLNEVSSVSALLFLVVPILAGGFHAGKVNLNRHSNTEHHALR